MSELTKEYFEQVVSGLATQKDLAGLATKEDLAQGLKTTEARIIKRIHESQEELARIVADTIATPFTKRFDRLEELLEVKDDVQTLKRQMSEIRAALHLSNT